jgi:hypothetical protein
LVRDRFTDSPIGFTPRRKRGDIGAGADRPGGGGLEISEVDPVGLPGHHEVPPVQVFGQGDLVVIDMLTPARHVHGAMPGAHRSQG